MTSMQKALWPSIAVLAAGAALGAFAACSTFESSESPADASTDASDAGASDAGAVDAPDDTSAPDASDARAESGACLPGGRDAGFTCGGTTCRASFGERCCLEASLYCFKGTCPGAQRNCASKSDCGTTKCCQAPSNAQASICASQCDTGMKTLCENDSECALGESCQLRTDYPFWTCEPCKK